MTIVLDNPKNFEGVEEAREWMWQQLQALEQGFNSGREFIALDERFEEPKKLKNGMIVLANGVVDAGPPVTGWDPGAGQGVYAYYGGAWHKLG